MGDILKRCKGVMSGDPEAENELRKPISPYLFGLACGLCREVDYRGTPIQFIAEFLLEADECGYFSLIERSLCVEKSQGQACIGLLNFAEMNHPAPKHRARSRAVNHLLMERLTSGNSFLKFDYWLLLMRVRPIIKSEYKWRKLGDCCYDEAIDLCFERLYKFAVKSRGTPEKWQRTGSVLAFVRKMMDFAVKTAISKCCRHTSYENEMSGSMDPSQDCPFQHRKLASLLFNMDFRKSWAVFQLKYEKNTPTEIMTEIWAISPGYGILRSPNLWWKALLEKLKSGATKVKTATVPLNVLMALCSMDFRLSYTWWQRKILKVPYKDLVHPGSIEERQADYRKAQRQLKRILGGDK